MSHSVGRVGGHVLQQGGSTVTFVGYTRPSTPQDIPTVAKAMRQADVAEVLAAEGLKPEESLLFCFMAGKPCMTICNAAGEPIAMWGVTPESKTIGRVWMLGTDQLVEDRRVRLRFLREVKDHLEQLLQVYAVLWNCVDARNAVHVRWIQWMGFTFVAKHSNYGAEGRLFLEFCKTSPCAHRLL